jgi:hypothetical protein
MFVDAGEFNRMTIRFVEFFLEIRKSNTTRNIYFILWVLIIRVRSMTPEAEDVPSFGKHRSVRHAMPFVATAAAFRQFVFIKMKAIPQR